MANIKSSKKRIRVIETKTAKNKRVKSRLKDILKQLDAAIEAGDKEEARSLLATAEKKLMQAVSKGTLHKNTASRKVSRLTKRFASEFGAEALKEKPEAAKPEKAPAKKAAAKKEEPKTEEPKEEAKEETASEEPKADEEKAETKKKAAPKKKSTKKESAEEADKAEEPETAEPEKED